MKQADPVDPSRSTAREGRCTCWPDAAVWTAFIKYAVLIQILWLIVYGGADWLTSQHDYRVRLHLAAELAIPFHPAAAIVYWSLLPLMWLSPFILASVVELRSFMVALAVAICLCGIGFVVLPSAPAYPRVEVEGPFAPIFHFADRANLTHNMCPSLHVAMATLAAFAYSRKLNRAAAIFIWLWAIAIALSTLLCHQHHLLDIVAGVVTGLICDRLIWNEY